MNNCVPGIGNYQKSQKKSSFNVFSGTEARNGGMAHIHLRSEGGRTGVCCGGLDMHGSRPGPGRPHCVKPFSWAPAFHS